MYFTIREKFKKEATGKITYKELEEREFNGVPANGDKIEVSGKFYRVDAVIIASGFKKDNDSEESLENFLDVVMVNKHYENENVKKVPRHDRYGHEIIENKDGSYYTVDKNGKKVREWDKDNNLKYGDKYPVINNKDSV